MCADCLPAWAGFGFTFAFTPSHLATPQEGEQGRVALGAVGKEERPKTFDIKKNYFR